MQCPKCSHTEAVKNGKVLSRQRYKCKSCGCNYTKSSRYRIDRETRVQCIRLYLEGVGFRGISRLTGVSHVIVQRWVKQLGDDIERFRPKRVRLSLLMSWSWMRCGILFKKKEQMLDLVSL